LNDFILLLDDDPSLCTYVTRVLEKNNYKIVTAHNGQEGLQIMSEYPVWATIVDDDMPVMSGLQFLKEIRYSFPTTLNILITGLNRLDTIAECLNQGLIYKYFQKPLDGDELLHALHEMRTLYELKKELITKQKNFKTEIQIRGTDIKDLLKIYDKFFVDNFKLIQLGQFSLSLLRQLQPSLHLIKLNLDFMEKSKKFSEVSIQQINLGLSSIQNTLNIMFNYFSNKINQKKQTVDLESFLDNMLKSIRSLLAEPDRFVFQVDFQTNIHSMYFHKAHLELILTSLITNAIEATYSVEKPEIRIIFKSDFSYFFIHVIDNGIGLREEFQDKIFDPFFSTKSSAVLSVWKEGIPKIGLGLWLVFHLLKEYESSIRFKRLPKGTEFIIQIPLKKILLKRK
jgi:signal transduction histidine kinase